MHKLAELYYIVLMNMIFNFITKAPLQVSFLSPFVMMSEKVGQFKTPLVNNLRQSSISFIEGLIDLDEEYIKSTTSPYFFNLIESQLQSLQSIEHNQSLLQSFASKLKLPTTSQSPESSPSPKNLQNYKLSIAPYVVFGTTIQQRKQYQPFGTELKITRNRYICGKGLFDNGIFNSLNKIFKNQSFGFKCIFDTTADLGYELIITIEGDLDTQQFYVVDLGQQLEATKVKELA